MKATKLYGDRYTLHEEVGYGGFATIYRATERDRSEEVAVKICKVADDPSYAKSLREEARTIQQFDHKNIVSLYPIPRQDKRGTVWYANALEIPGTPVFFVMEFLRGGSLETYVKQVGRLSVPEASMIAVEIARALYHMHQHNYAHNDLKLENILFRERIMAGRSFTPVLVDFGIATRVQQPNAGSLYIMPPEKVAEVKLQTPPEMASTDQTKVDVWGLGVVLYRMLGGALPFVGRNERSLTQRIRSSRPMSLEKLSPDIPPEIDQLIIDGCLAKNPQHRLTMIELGYLLRDIVGNGSVVAQQDAESNSKGGFLGRLFGRG